MFGRRRTERDRIGQVRRCGCERGQIFARPGLFERFVEGIALRGRFQEALGARRQSQGELVDGRETRLRRVGDGAPGGGAEQAVIAQAAMLNERLEPDPQAFAIMDVA